MFDSRGPLEALVGLLNGLGIDGQAGVPQGGPKLFGYVALAGQSIRQLALRTKERKSTYYVGLAYRVEGAESDAELALADALDLLLAALLADSSLSGTSDRAIEIDLTAAGQPEYRDFAKVEYRTYPVLVTVIQHDS